MIDAIRGLFIMLKETIKAIYEELKDIGAK
jgi:hypothetical protein